MTDGSDLTTIAANNSYYIDRNIMTRSIGVGRRGVGAPFSAAGLHEEFTE